MDFTNETSIEEKVVATDEELESVVGGIGRSPRSTPKYQIGQHLWKYWPTSMNYSHWEVREIRQFDPSRGYLYVVNVLSSRRPGATEEQWLETLPLYPYDPEKTY